MIPILLEGEPYSSISLCPSHNTVVAITPYSYLNIIPFHFKFLAVKIMAILFSFTWPQLYMTHLVSLEWSRNYLCTGLFSVFHFLVSCLIACGFQCLSSMSSVFLHNLCFMYRHLSNPVSVVCIDWKWLYHWISSDLIYCIFSQNVMLSRHFI